MNHPYPHPCSKMSSKRAAYKCLSVAETKQIIEAVASGEKKKDVANRFSIPLSTLTSIIYGHNCYVPYKVTDKLCLLLVTTDKGVW